TEMYKFKLWAFIACILAVVTALATAAQLQTPTQGTLTGTVTSNGKPMEGVAVSARLATKTFTTTVYTDENGMYSFPVIEDGRYAVWAQAVGFEAAKTEQVITGGKKARLDLELTTVQDLAKQLGGDEVLA